MSLLDNTYFLSMGKYHCMADLLFERFGFNQTRKSVVNLT